MTFLYPFFLILLAVPFALFFLRKKIGIQTPWKKWIDARLLPYLLKHGQNKQIKRAPFWLFSIIWTLWTLALAGPAIQIQTPTYLNTNSTVIVLDLNSTGTGQQWIKTRAKLSDLLEQLADEQVALVLYDAKGYIVTPLTTDKNILRTIIPTLSIDVLPTAQNKPETGFQTAEKLLKNIQSSDGRILFITGGGFDTVPVSKIIEQSPYQTAVLFIPNTPDDTISLPASTQYRTADDSDIRALLAATPQTPAGAVQSDKTTVTYQNIGIWLVVCSLPFFLLLFRKNAVFLFILAFTMPAHAHLFLRADQQAYQSAQQAVTAFDTKQYDQAHTLFLNNDALYELPADALYNAANALAYAGKINEALALYEQVLTENPTHADAQFNKEYLEKQLPPQQNQQQSDSADSQNNTDESDQSENSNSDSSNTSDASDTESQQTENNADNSNTESEQNQSETDTSDNTTNPQSDDLQQDEQQPEQPTTGNADTNDESEQQPADSSAQLEQNPAPQTTAANDETQQILNKIQEDPSRLLRNRLYQQYRRQQ